MAGVSGPVSTSPVPTPLFHLPKPFDAVSRDSSFLRTGLTMADSTAQAPTSPKAAATPPQGASLQSPTSPKSAASPPPVSSPKSAVSPKSPVSPQSATAGEGPEPNATLEVDHVSLLSNRAVSDQVTNSLTHQRDKMMMKEHSTSNCETPACLTGISSSPIPRSHVLTAPGTVDPPSPPRFPLA